MKAMLYLQVIDKPEKGKEILAKIKKSYPDTRSARTSTACSPPSISSKLRPNSTPGSLPAPSSLPSPSPASTVSALSLAGYKGKVVLVDFWATWCGPCVDELPNVIAAYKKYHDKGFEIVGISLDQDKAKLEEFLKEKGMTWPQFLDGKG